MQSFGLYAHETGEVRPRIVKDQGIDCIRLKGIEVDVVLNPHDPVARTGLAALEFVDVFHESSRDSRAWWESRPVRLVSPT